MLPTPALPDNINHGKMRHDEDASFGRVIIQTSSAAWPRDIGCLVHKSHVRIFIGVRRKRMMMELEA